MSFLSNVPANTDDFFNFLFYYFFALIEIHSWRPRNTYLSMYDWLDEAPEFGHSIRCLQCLKHNTNKGYLPLTI